MKKAISLWLLSAVTLLLAACGGGSGSAGTNIFGSSGSGTGTGKTTAATYATSVVIQRSGTTIATPATISSTETVQAVATVVSPTGAPVGGVVVKFNEDGNAGLLKFAPTTATALTDANGLATLDIAAKDTSQAGATTVTGTASIGTVTAAGSTSFAIQTGQVSQQAPTPTAINFVGVVPTDKAIVLKGAGGNGRSESATLTFTVVDANKSPIKGATVAFSVNPTGQVTLNIPTAVSDANGQVTTTVQSGTVATSVVVAATAQAAPTVVGYSDTLIVSNGAAVAGHFEIVPTKYNLDGNLTGDSTTVSAYAVDANGNPVPDGVAVSFATNYGGIASSNLGGCLTVNGICSVTFRVQDPRGADGVATVMASVRVGTGTTLTTSKPINMSGSTGGYLQAGDGIVSRVSSLTMGSCKQTFGLILADSVTANAAPSGTAVSFFSGGSGLSVSVPAGSPVLDSRPLADATRASGFSFPGNAFGVAVDASSTDVSPPCKAGGTVKAGASITLAYKTPGGLQYLQPISLQYPQ